MCGIAGIIKNDYSTNIADKIKSMLLVLGKRGPDDSGIIEFPNCLLGQTRLSIIDLNNGHQPMQDFKEKAAITFNGEIYNYQELKKDLERKGYIFKTNTDTEVILNAYLEYGEKCLDLLDGMFAFAIWDKEKKLLFAARDRFGKKPFYYAFLDNNDFAFSSEIKALFATNLLKGIINYQAIDNYLNLMYIPPHTTVYENIFTLKPAHYLIYKDGKVEQKRYWELKHQPININYKEAKEKLYQLLDNSVKKRMVADVEIGSLLSGGVDSSIISYLAQSHLNKPIKTFSIGYGKFINELDYASKAAKIIKSDHYELDFNDNIFEELMKTCEYFDQPHADSSNLSTSIISKFAREKVKVVLSGDGADELFLGYGWHWVQWNLSKRNKIIQLLSSNPYKDHFKYIQFFNEKERRKLWKNKKIINNAKLEKESYDKGLSFLNNINLFDLNTYLPGQLLYKLDMATMMNSLEARCPFLDYKLAEFVFNLPQEFKTDKSKGKIILKDLFEEVFSKEFMNRRKQGFGAPVNHWLKRDDFKKLLKDHFENEACIYDFLNKETILSYIRNIDDSQDKLIGNKVWILLCLELWYKNNKKYFA